jgi:hypothetical protein
VAPIDGTILVKKAETGSTINPQGFSGSYCLCELADRAKGAIGVRVRIILPEGDNRLRPDSRVLVSFMKKRPGG